MELAELLRQPGLTLVDVRESYVFEEGHLPNAINIPLGDIFARLPEFEQMTKPIVVYCKTGDHAGQAKLLLEMNGIDEVYNGGGMEAVAQLLAQAA